MMAGDTLFTFLTDSRQSAGKFLALMTEGPKGQRIPNHMHEKHTETFFSLNGSVSMTAGEEHVSLHPGDFLHVPACTPHTFQLTGNNTRFIQFHAPGLNEPFFRYMCDPCEEYTFLQPPPPFRFDRVIQHLAELDVKFLQSPADGGLVLAIHRRDIPSWEAGRSEMSSRAGPVIGPRR